MYFTKLLCTAIILLTATVEQLMYVIAIDFSTDRYTLMLIDQ